MRKLIITVAIALLCLIPTAGAAADDYLFAVNAMGIIEGNGTDPISLSSTVTRAQYTKMLVAASSMADSVGEGYGFSLYKDVKTDHWASPYIKVAVYEGWTTGYLDGTYRPDQIMKIEEAVSGLLKLLGYDSSQITGAYPSAHLSQASALGLLDGLSVTTGSALTIEDCTILFYNLMLCETAGSTNAQGVAVGGSSYGSSLGYTITDGAIDYGSLVSEGTSGPFVAAGGNMTLPFDTSAATIYRDGAEMTAGSVQNLDVYYYNSAMRTVWVYSDKVTGTITELGPNLIAPTSVSIWGQSYAIAGSASYDLSAQGGYKVGDTVTLLLGMEGSVVAVSDSTAASGHYYGIVIASETALSTAGDATQVSTTVVCTDGVQRSFLHDGHAYSGGQLVGISISSKGTTVETLSSGQVTSGKVNSDATMLGSTPFAANVEILDVDADDNYVRLYPTRLAGYTLTNSDIRFAVKNANGEITHLILDDATGDAGDYAYLAWANETNEDDKAMGSYGFVVNGQTQSLTTEGYLYLESGGVRLHYDESGKIEDADMLEETTVSTLSDYSAVTADGTLPIATEVEVLLRSGGEYVKTTLQDVLEANYRMTAFYETDSGSAGGQIRVIVAIAG